MKAWSQAHLTWVKSAVHFAHAAQEATLLDYVHEVDHVVGRLERLERAIDEAVKTAPERMRTVIAALQALRGIARVSAVTIVAEVGHLSRFANPRQLMGYSGVVASEDSSGRRIRRGAITKTGNAHLRRVIVEAAWAYRHRPSVGATLRKRHAPLDEHVIALAWKAQHRLHGRYRSLTARGKSKQSAVTAVGRELLGFIWAIGMAVEPSRPDGRPLAA
jgi:transposase